MPLLQGLKVIDASQFNAGPIVSLYLAGYGAEVIKVEQPGTMTAGEFRRAMRDLVNFLTYVGEPAKITRHHVGFWVLIFLAFFFFLSYLLYKEYWKDVH